MAHSWIRQRILRDPLLRAVVLCGGALILCSCGTVREADPSSMDQGASEPLARIRVAPDGHGFVLARRGRPFRPWGLNYGNRGRLLEDFWEKDWSTVAADFVAMKTLGANVVRVHLQVARFMNSPTDIDPGARLQLARLVRLAEQTGLYLDVTGLGCYRPADAPAWYDALDEPARWAAQAVFWDAVAETCGGSPAVFCFDLINEPISPSVRREPGRWSSGNLFGGYDFVQYIALDPERRPREAIAVEWIRRMKTTIRRRDPDALITVGLLPWGQEWKHLSGFVPSSIVADLDFLSVHLYPDRARPGEALEALRQVAVGKPVVIEETYSLRCSAPEWVEFMRASRGIVEGWMGHYDGLTPDDLDELEQSGRLTVVQALQREWLRRFAELKHEFAP